MRRGISRETASGRMAHHRAGRLHPVAWVGGWRGTSGGWLHCGGGFGWCGASCIKLACTAPWAQIQGCADPDWEHELTDLFWANMVCFLLLYTDTLRSFRVLVKLSPSAVGKRYLIFSGLELDLVHTRFRWKQFHITLDGSCISLIGSQSHDR